MSTYKRNRDTVASSVYTTDQKLSVEKWLEDTTKRIEEPVISLELTMPEKCLGILEQRPDMDKGLLERDHEQGDKIVDGVRPLKVTVCGQEETLKEAELRGDILQETITSLQEQLTMQELSMQDSFQQHSDLKNRLSMHERLLELADQQINTQQELIKHLLEGQASTSRQLALISQKLSQQPERSAQQPQVEEAEGQQSNPGGVNKSTVASDYVLVSEDESTSS